MQWKKTCKKIWHFVWKEDSFLSWVVNIILAFVLIKFVVYPALGWMLGTSYPVVAVVSGSMEHKLVHPCSSIDSFGQCSAFDKNSYEICGKRLDKKSSGGFDIYWELCGDWYLERNLTKGEFIEFPFKNGFNTGDIIVLKGIAPKDIRVGQVIVFQTPYRADPIIHRVVDIEQNNNYYIYGTKGDHNAGKGDVDRNIPEQAVIGRAYFRIPFLGYVKIAFMKLVYGIISLF